MGRSISIPLTAGKLVLGNREEPLIIDMESNARRREFHVQVMGEGPQQQQQPRRQAPAQRKKR